VFEAAAGAGAHEPARLAFDRGAIVGSEASSALLSAVA
jgi:hypothetical protein